MNLIIRQEVKADHKKVNQLIEKAFRSETMSDQQEHILVERLRKSSSFIPELSLVAELNNEIVGQILLTKVLIVNQDSEYDALALAPVSVVPKFQGKRIGSSLIRKSHMIAKEMGFTLIVLLGLEKYYPRFGYERADKHEIQFPFDAPSVNCMVYELQENVLQHISGTVKYPQEFF